MFVYVYWFGCDLLIEVEWEYVGKVGCDDVLFDVVLCDV